MFYLPIIIPKSFIPLPHLFTNSTTSTMKEFFQYSRGEFYATVVLLALIVIVYSLYFFCKPRFSPETDWSEFQAEIENFYAQQQFYADSLEQEKLNRQHYYQHRYEKKPKYTTAYHSKQFDKYSYVAKDSFIRNVSPKKPSYQIVKIDLNSCDTADIVKIPQFGYKRAQKIIEYREKLGGFYALEQLKEIYILQNIDLQYCERYFYLEPNQIRYIYINKATYKQLIAHPYFDAYLAKTIIAYREKHGKIHNKDEFQKVTHAYDELMERITPYLKFE